MLLSTSDEFVNLVEELNKQKETLTEIEKEKQNYLWKKLKEKENSC